MGVGADGFMIDVHPAPDQAKVDGAQAILPEEFAALMDTTRRIADAVGLTV